MCACFSDFKKISDGMRDKFHLLLQRVSTFVTGLIVALVYGWRLTLVVLSLSPLILVVSYLFGKVRSRFDPLNVLIFI